MRNHSLLEFHPDFHLDFAIFYYLTISLIFMQDSGIKLLARSDDNLYAKLIYKARIRKPAA